MPQDYLVVYFPCFTGYLCEDAWAAATELTDPSPTRRLIEEGLRSNEARRMARAILDELLASTFGDQGPELLMALAQPLDREHARMVRGTIQRRGGETAERWALIVALSKVANVSILARRQWRAFARPEWLAAALAKNPAHATYPMPELPARHGCPGEAVVPVIPARQLAYRLLQLRL